MADYGELARKLGGTPVGKTGGAVDYSALAKELGGEEFTPLASVPGQTIANLPASAAKFAGDIYTVVTSPVETAKGLADLAAGAFRAGAKQVLPSAVFNFIDQLDNPETTQRISATANAVGGKLAEDYGSYEAIKRKVATDPVGFAGDMSMLLTGGGLAAARVAPTTANAMMRAGAAIDPLNAALRVGVGSANAMRTATQQARAVAAVVPDALKSTFDPNTVILNRLGQDPAAMAAALRATQDLPVTPGAPAPTLSERLIEGRAPSAQVAALERGMASSPEVAQELLLRQRQQAAAIQEQLARVENQIRTQAAALTPDELGNLKQVRDSLLRSLAEQQKSLVGAGQAVAEGLPTVRQAEVGGAIQEQARAGLKELKQTEIRPAFEKAFAAAPGPSIDLSGALGTARELIGDIGTLVDPSRVSSGVRNLLRVEPKPSGELPPLPPIVSLEDFQSIRSSLLKQSRAVREADPVRAMNIDRVVREMDDAFESSSIPQAARTQYETARGLVSEVQVPRYGTGETAMALGKGPRNMPKRLPSQQVEGFLKTEESAAQFARTFKDDPAAVQSMQQGVLDLYRQDVVNPVTGLVDPRKAAAFEAKYARQLDTLEASGLSVKGTLGQVRQDATKAQTALDALAAETKKFKGAKDAAGVVDLALKSPMDMQFVRDRLSPAAREALGGELISRATSAIDKGDPAAALKYLKQNEKALKAGLGKKGAQTYDELVRVANLQEEFAKVSAQAPKTEIVTPVTLARDYTPAELTDLQVVVNDLKRMRQVEELGTPPDVAAKRLGTEGAESIGARPQDWPAFFSPMYTSFKNVAKKALERLDKKSVAAFMDLAVRDPDKLIPMLEAAAAKKTAAAARVPPKRLEAPTVLGAPIAAAGALQNRMTEQENRNAMAR